MEILLNIAIVIFLYMTIVVLLALIRKDNSIVDFFWGLGFILVSFYSLINYGSFTFHNILLNSLVLLWGLRLSIHIYIRNKGKPEDFRYKAWRDSWKFFVIRSYFQIFMLQGFFMLIISSPVWFSNFHPEQGICLNDYIGLLLYAMGLFFEIAGDQQLNVFKRNPANKGKIMTTGLWRITRHPNYFGEALIWWGIGMFALDLPGGWMTLISPLLITLLLRFVSGVPMLEKKYEGREDWEEYKKRTAVFIPFIRFF
jgi:steroid 5-alpha reductase family enzyme